MDTVTVALIIHVPLDMASFSAKTLHLFAQPLLKILHSRGDVPQK